MGETSTQKGEKKEKMKLLMLVVMEMLIKVMAIERWKRRVDSCFSGHKIGSKRLAKAENHHTTCRKGLVETISLVINTIYLCNTVFRVS